MNAQSSRPGGSAVHRLLDELFAELPSTPDALDLKEEIRANLVARASELEEQGVGAEQAARTAVDELGDVRELLADASPTRTAAEVAAANRVRHRPGFVVRTVLIAIASGLSLVALWFGSWNVFPLPFGTALALAGVASLGLGIIIGDALHQETSVHHPMPTRRALLFGLAGGLVIAGVTSTFAMLTHAVEPAWLIAPAVAAIAGIGLFSYLGATQTNRTKAWALEHGRSGESYPGDRFEKDPKAAARFGIYTMLIWVSAFLVSIVLYMTVGWTWAWIPYVVGFLGMMLLLTRMLFGDHEDREPAGRKGEER
jgi:hypothetical protein